MKVYRQTEQPVLEKWLASPEEINLYLACNGRLDEEELARRLGKPLTRVRQLLARLEELGLIEVADRTPLLRARIVQELEEALGSRSGEYVRQVAACRTSEELEQTVKRLIIRIRLTQSRRLGEALQTILAELT